jgi:hypothetical protein
VLLQLRFDIHHQNAKVIRCSARAHDIVISLLPYLFITPKTFEAAIPLKSLM